MIKRIEHFIKYIMEGGIYMNNKFEVVPATNKGGFRNTFLPEEEPFQLRNTKVEKVGDKLIATAYGLTDLLALSICGRFTIA